VNDEEARRGVGWTAKALEDAILQLMSDDESRRRAWLNFTDDLSIADESEPVAELAFTAGYATAMQHIGRLLGALSEATSA
jgi:hypothetical protein